MRSTTTLLLLALGLAACSSDSEPARSSAPPGEGGAGATKTAAPAPIEVVDLAGLEAALAARKGKGFLLNFWAIWCPPCVAEMPELVETAHAWRERGGAVLTVNYDLMLPDVTAEGVRAQVREFATERGIDLPVYIYEALDFEAIDARFDLPGAIPVTLAIDAAGRIVDRQDGQADRARFEALMAAALR
jgi:thiol-disulfide isomerase/thioredoxin